MIFGLNFKKENTEANRIILRDVYNYAWKNSQDPSTKTTAAIFNQYLKPGNEFYNPLIFGANRLKKGIEAKFSPKELVLKMKDSIWKRKNMEHSEDASIRKLKELYNQAIESNDKEKQELYQSIVKAMAMPWIPCEPCGEIMVDYGIKKLITHESFINKTPEDWKESTLRGVELLLDNHIEIVTYSGEIGDCYALFRGKHWRP